jgi:hypothetical protein
MYDLNECANQMAYYSQIRDQINEKEAKAHTTKKTPNQVKEWTKSKP